MLVDTGLQQSYKLINVHIKKLCFQLLALSSQSAATKGEDILGNYYANQNFVMILRLVQVRKKKRNLVFFSKNFPDLDIKERTKHFGCNNI